ncbi:acyltransferase family protein [Taibaiella lutea]|uniref:acyltransferase family protein n=1 Tax=Taibaiella lutea TaxID=2608001 RepID=UPI00167FDF82|nr:acyltransferase [Taibaiella lutea]
METAASHKNNFDFLRFLFASLVIFSHSYALLLGNIALDPFVKRSDRALSEIAVCGFFVLSGFLIRQSQERSSSVFSFFRKRALRIVPGLWVAIVVTVFVIGCLTTEIPLAAYLSNSQTWKYLFSNSFLMPVAKELPGVFNHNPETGVNGSLWTLRYEILFYALLSFLFFIPKKNSKAFTIAALIICIAGYMAIKMDLVPVKGNFLFYFFNLGIYFAGGACLSLFTDFIKQRKSLLLCISSIIFFAFTFIFKKEYELINMFSFTLLVISFGLHYFKFLNFSQYTGDISYGTYIYAYPIQQALIIWLHPANIWTLMIPSFLVAWLAGWLSWHFIEKRFLKRK